MTRKATTGYYNEKVINKFSEALNNAKTAIRNTPENELHVKISDGNSKMGKVASVSTLPFLTCPECCAKTCGVKCYAAKIANLYPTVLDSYAWNTALAIYKPRVYWNGIDEACKAVKYFRFHVSGDIMNAAYFKHMIDTANNNPSTEILVFTKRFEIVNKWIDNNGDLPKNLHVLYSAWNNLTPNNPHNMPETNVILKGAEPEENWKLCGGNCFNCACRGVGCWQAQKGDVIAFKIH